MERKECFFLFSFFLLGLFTLLDDSLWQLFQHFKKKCMGHCSHNSAALNMLNKAIFFSFTLHNCFYYVTGKVHLQRISANSCSFPDPGFNVQVLKHVSAWVYLKKKNVNIRRFMTSKTKVMLVAIIPLSFPRNLS